MVDSSYYYYYFEASRILDYIYFFHPTWFKRRNYERKRKVQKRLARKEGDWTVSYNHYSCTVAIGSDWGNKTDTLIFIFSIFKLF